MVTYRMNFSGLFSTSVCPFHFDASGFSPLSKFLFSEVGGASPGRESSDPSLCSQWSLCNIWFGRIAVRVRASTRWEDGSIERDNYKVALIEVISDSDWAADRESCDMVNGNLAHFQSTRQKSVALSSCEGNNCSNLYLVTRWVLERIVLKRILGVEPKLVLFSDSWAHSSSSRENV